MFLLFAYNVLVFSSTSENYLPDTVLKSFVIPSSGATLTITWNILFILAGICILYLEILKSTRTSYLAVIDHLLSLVVFVIFLIEFIVLKEMGSATFLILTLLSLIDVIAGFTVTLSAARRDIAIDS